MSPILIRIAVFLLVSCGPIFGQAISFLAPVVTTQDGGGKTVGSTFFVVGDFNHDGKPDIAFEPPNDAFVFPPIVLFGNGDGTFRAGPVLSTPGQPLTADFNGDGITDILVGPAGRTNVILSNGDGTFRAPVAVPDCVGFSVIGDFNGDGKADLICQSAVLLGKGDGTFQTPIPQAVGGNLLVADFNHDGILDIMDLQPSNALAVALGHGDGTFAAEVVAVAAAPGFQFGVTGDFNGDGILDLAGFCTEAGSMCVLPGKGDGTFGPGIINQGLTELPQAAGDFNKDGKLDLVAGDGAVLAGNGDGTFRVPVFIHPGFAVIADFNGDGQPDIIESVASKVASFGSLTLQVLVNDSPGDGFYTAGVSSASWTWPVAAGSITSAFGANLARQTAAASATGDSLPTTLGGIRVHIRDSTGDSLAPLIYVSSTQINYVMTSSDNFAWIGIEQAGTTYIPKASGSLR
jgi:FG-GAP-like repeat